MTLFALNVALTATMAALIGLVAERSCQRRAVALRHALLFVCLSIVAAAPLLAGVAKMTGIGLLQTTPTPPASEPMLRSPAVVDATPNSASVTRVNVKQVANEPNSRLDSAHWAAALPSIFTFLMTAWAAGTIYQFLRIVQSWRLLRRMSWMAENSASCGAGFQPAREMQAQGPHHNSQARPYPDVRRLTANAARRLGLRWVPSVSWCAAAPTPLVMGLFRPRVLLPYATAAFSTDELEAVLLHELAHVARGDSWAGLGVSCIRALFWWCLPVELLIRRLGDLREQLCDAQVVRCQGHGLNLATALLSVCEGAMRGRLAYAAAALGAAGRSGSALRNRIQSLTNEDEIPMIHTTFRTRMALGVVGLLISCTATIMNVRTAVAAAGNDAKAAQSMAQLLEAKDFWQKTGATSKHDFDKAAVADLQKIADEDDRPDMRLRAFKLLCDQQGHTHRAQKFNDADSARAVAAAFEYLESHLKDREVAKYAPDLGFSHMTLSEMADDKDAAWVLIETAGRRPNFNGGLNIRYSLKTSLITAVKQWGDVRPPAPAKPPKQA